MYNLRTWGKLLLCSFLSFFLLFLFFFFFLVFLFLGSSSLLVGCVRMSTGGNFVRMGTGNVEMALAIRG